MLPALLQTTRTTLRPFRFNDVEDVFEYANDEEWSRYLFVLPVPYTWAHAERFVAAQILLDRGETPSWAIELQGRVAGGISLQFCCEHRVAELGYAIARSMWGQGLAVEAATAVLAAAFKTDPQLNRIRARTDARNIRAIRVMEKLGMTREAVLREDRSFRGQLVDEVVYGVLRRERNQL
jgi:ribosomal-protein-alanine N-acetyltransferase